MAITKKLSDPYSWAGKVGIGTGPVPLGHFRSKTLEIGSDAATRPELPAKQMQDARKSKGGKS